MLPKIQNQNGKSLKKEVLTANIIQEDHVKNILAKANNNNYKPWKAKHCPSNPHSVFGNFPKSFCIKPVKINMNQKPKYINSFANTDLSILIRL